MRQVLQHLALSPINLAYNFQLDSVSISYEDEFLAAKGAPVSSHRLITVDELKAAYKRKYGDRCPNEVMRELVEKQNAIQVPDHFDLEGPQYKEDKLGDLMAHYYKNYGNRLPVFKTISSNCDAPAIPSAVEPEGTKPANQGNDQEQVVLRSWVNQKTGFKHKVIRWTFNGNPEDAVDVENVYNIRDEYIGDKDIADMLHKRGISPQIAQPGHNVCSIGFCHREQKWYGWSHRAIYGYGIGNSVRKGDCAYNPDTKEAFIESLRAWHDDGFTEKEDIRITPTPTGARVQYKYANSELGYDSEEEFKPGRGEWQANTLEEAKQMAIDFAESVSTVTSADLSSESATKKQFPPTSYVWYTFGGRRTKEFDHHRSNLSMSLENGEKFGILFNEKTGLVHLVEKENLEYEFRIEPRTIKSWLKKSKPFGGKINNQRVQRGNGQFDQLTTNKLVKAVEPGVVIDDHTKAKVRVATPAVKKPIKPSRIDKSKEVFGVFFKPNAAVEKYMLIIDNNLANLKKTLKAKIGATKNLGSDPKFLAIPSEHRLLQKASSKGFAYYTNAHLMVLQKDSKDLSTSIRKTPQIGAEDIQLAERSPTKLELKAPFFDGNQVVILKELRDEVITGKKLSGNMSVRGKNGGLFKSGGKIYVEFLLPNSSNKCKKEAKGFIRRLEVQSRKKFKATEGTLEVDGVMRDLVRVFVNVKPYKTPEDGKLAREIHKLVKSGAINDSNSYMLPQYDDGEQVSDLAVSFVKVDYSKPAIVVKPIRGNLAEVYTKKLHATNGRKIV